MDFKPNKLQNMPSLLHIEASFEPKLEAYRCLFTNGLFSPLTFKVILDRLTMLFMLFEAIIAKLELH